MRERQALAATHSNERNKIGFLYCDHCLYLCIRYKTLDVIVLGSFSFMVIDTSRLRRVSLSNVRNGCSPIIQETLQEHFHVIVY